MLQRLKFVLVPVASFSIASCNGAKERCVERHETTVSCFQNIDASLGAADFKAELQKCAPSSAGRARDGRKGVGGERRPPAQDRGDKGGRKTSKDAQERSKAKHKECFEKSTPAEQKQCFINLFQERKARCGAGKQARLILDGFRAQSDSPVRFHIQHFNPDFIALL